MSRSRPPVVSATAVASGVTKYCATIRRIEDKKAEALRQLTALLSHVVGVKFNDSCATVRIDHGMISAGELLSGREYIPISHLQCTDLGFLRGLIDFAGAPCDLEMDPLCVIFVTESAEK
jgi:hypothetical protein